MITEHWKHRRSVRQFIDKEVDYALIQDLIDIIPCIPCQNGIVDHWWVIFGPDDFKYKEWLVDNIYHAWYEQKTDGVDGKEYFTGLMTAPYLFHSFKINPYRYKTNNELIRNNAFHAGVIVSQAVDKGLDVAPIACMDGWNEDKTKDYRDLIWEKFGPILKDVKHIYHEENIFSADTIVRPMMSIGVGHGQPVNSNYGNAIRPYKDGISVLDKKSQKTMENVSVWN